MNVGTRRVSSLRTEDAPLIRGAGSYVADLVPEGALHCGFVRSPVAHGWITSIDRSRVAAATGVAGTFVAGELPMNDIPGNTGRGPAAVAMTRPPLARGKVRYVGEPLVVIAAESAAAAEDAIDLAWVEIDELPAITSGEDSLATTNYIFESPDGNLVSSSFIETGEPLTAPSHVSVTVEVKHQRLAPITLEPLAILAVPEGNGVHVWCAHQAPHRLRNQLASLLDLEPGHVRVTVPDVGGAFGMKGMLYPEYLVTTAVALAMQRPAAWIQHRREQIIGGTHGRAQRHRITLEGDSDGRLRRAHIDVLAETGAYPHNGSQIPNFGRLVATGLYHIPRVGIETKVVVTNLAPTGSYRGAGRPEAALTIERGIDAFARTAGLDPLEVRLKNAITSDQLPYETVSGSLYDSGDYSAALRKAADMVDLPALRAEQRERHQQGRALLGIGFGGFVERAGGEKSSWEYSRVEIDPDAQRVVVRTGSTDSGQGHQTVWSDVARAVFEDTDIHVVAGDTATVADGIGTFASRSAQIGASGVLRSSQRVLEAATKRAAEKIEAAEADLRYSAGVFTVAGSPGNEVTIWELAAESELVDEEYYSPGEQTFPYGVHAAVVEVELETGEVRVRRIVAVDDCGVILNSMIVEGQLHGSLAQGLGQSLLEEVLYDEHGQPLTPSLVTYSIPTAAEMPPVTSARLESPAPSNPLGVKGAGEAGCIGLPPAILNAAIDALAPLGVTDLQLPLRPNAVWQAIQDAKDGHG